MAEAIASQKAELILNSKKKQLQGLYYSIFNNRIILEINHFAAGLCKDIVILHCNYASSQSIPCLFSSKLWPLTMGCINIWSCLAKEYLDCLANLAKAN